MKRGLTPLSIEAFDLLSSKKEVVILDTRNANDFSQAFIRSSGIIKYLENPTAYKKNLGAGKRGGRSVGISTGYTWVANLGAKA
jgi:hypothetical protein